MTAPLRSKDDADITFGDLEVGDLFIYENGTCTLVLRVVPPKGTALITSLVDVKILVVTPTSFVTQRRVGGRDTIYATNAKRFKRNAHASET